MIILLKLMKNFQNNIKIWKFIALYI